jgi:hypothetical protein
VLGLLVESGAAIFEEPDWLGRLDPTSPPVEAPEPFTEMPDPLAETEGVDPTTGDETEGA